MKDLTGLHLDKYQIVARLGQGAMARVYKAYQANLDRYVALKVLHDHLTNDDTFVARFEQEAANIARLRHHNILQVHDFDYTDGIYYMVIEYIEGPTLRSELEKRAKSTDQPFSLTEISAIITSLAAAVDYAHGRQMIHRDIKPGNVIFTADGHPLLTDFGLSKLLGDTNNISHGSIAGTPNYMSPEQCEGKELDTRSDIYTLGVILYELLTGRPPFHSNTPFGVILQHMSDPFPPLPTTYADAIQQVVNRAAAKNPDNRYQNASDLAIAFRQAADLTLTDNLPTIKLEASAQVEDQFSPDTTRSYASTDVSILPNPYRGLYAFREEDAPYFFGRETFTERLVKNIRSNAMVAVVGPSGSGKSSVVFAGMIPQLRQQGGWLVVHSRPGSQPFYNLAVALITQLEPDLKETDQLIEAKKLATALRANDIHLQDVCQRIIDKHEAKHLLLVSDQFEELFTLCQDVDEQRAYPLMLFETINRAEQAEHSPFCLAITLRADFMNLALTQRPFADALQDNDVKLGPMTREELGRAITNPAKLHGVTFESGLVDRILDDVGREPGNLPLLEFALTLLWDNRAGRRLTHSAYDAIGQVEGALARYADEIYNELSPANQERARRVFTQMVRPGEGTEDTRRVSTRAELGEADWVLAKYLADARLVVIDLTPDGQETVEVVHEALIRGWQQLRQWMNHDRSFRTWQERLRSAQRQWLTSNNDEGALLRGALLAEAEEWLQTRSDELSPYERNFIQASIDLRENQQAELEAQRQRELKTARQLAAEQERRAEAEHQRAEEQLQSTNRLRLLSYGLGVIFLLAIGAALVARSQQQTAVAAQATAEAESFARATEVLIRATAESQAVANADLATTREAQAVAAQATAEAERVRADQQANLAVQEQERANEQANLALARQLSAQATTLINNNFPLAILLNLEALNRADIIETRGSLLNTLQSNPRLQQLINTNINTLQEIKFSPTGHQFALAGGDGTLQIWDTATATPTLNFIGHDPTMLINSVLFTPDGTQIISASDDETIRVWDATTGDEQMVLRGHQGFVQNLAISPNGQILASGGGGGDFRLHLWDLNSGQPLFDPLPGHNGNIWYVDFSPDNKTVATAGWDGTLKIWDATTGTLITDLTNHNTNINRAVFSPDGRWLASGDGDGIIILWDTTTWTQVGSSLTSNDAATGHLIFSSDSNFLISTSFDSNIMIWQISAHSATTTAPTVAGSPLRGHSSVIIGADLHPDSPLLVATDYSGSMIYWDLNATTWPVINSQSPSSGSLYDADITSDWTIATGDNNQIFLWPTNQLLTTVETSYTLTHTPAITGPIIALAASADNNTIASASSNGTIRLWSATDGLLTQTLSIIPLNSLQLALSPDASLVAAGSPAGTLAVLNSRTGSFISNGTIVGHTDSINDITFSPDQQTIATVGQDGALIIHPIVDGQLSTLGKPLTYTDEIPLTAVAYTPDSTTLFTGDAQGYLMRWSVTGRQIQGRWKLPTTAPLLHILTTPNPDILAIADETGTVHLWNHQTGEPATNDTTNLPISPLTHDTPLLSLRYQVANNQLITVDENGQQLSWDPLTGAQLNVQQLPLPADYETILITDPFIISGHYEQLVTISPQTTTDEPITYTHQPILTTSVSQVAISPDGHHFATGTFAGDIIVWDLDRQQPIINPLQSYGQNITHMVYSPDGHYLAIQACRGLNVNGVCTDTRIDLWDTDSYQLQTSLIADTGYPFDFEFTPDSQQIYGIGCAVPVDPISGCLRGAVNIWDLDSGEIIHQITGATSPLRALALSPNGRYLAVGDRNGIIQLIDLDTQTPLGAPLTAHAGAMQELVFSPDNTTLASAAQDNNIIFWDVPTQQIIGTQLNRHFGPPTAAAFTPDGHQLITTSFDGYLFTWDITLDNWIQRACSITQRNLTPTEWQQFFPDEPYRPTCPQR
ncbi:MAG TPA: protein kinase [Anaerolineae bacterium]|nr:protein kinase [Anaerolineae bacterium]